MSENIFEKCNDGFNVARESEKTVKELQAALAEKDAELAKLKHERKQDEYKFIRNHNDYYKELCGLRNQLANKDTELASSQHCYNLLAEDHARLQAEKDAEIKRLKFSRRLIADAHNLYKDGDSDIPDRIVDMNGEVVLGLCKDCGCAEGELEDTCDKRRIIDKLQVELDWVMGEAAWAMHQLGHYIGSNLDTEQSKVFDKIREFMSSPLIQNWRAQQGEGGGMSDGITDSMIASKEDPYTFEIARIKRAGELDALRYQILQIQHYLEQDAWKDTVRGSNFKKLGLAIGKAEKKLGHMRMLLNAMNQIDANND